MCVIIRKSIVFYLNYRDESVGIEQLFLMLFMVFVQLEGFVFLLPSFIAQCEGIHFDKPKKLFKIKLNKL